MARADSFLKDLARAYLSPPEEERKIDSTPRILVVTHGGFIMEFMNVVRSLSGKAPIMNNNARNTSVYLIRFSMNPKKMKNGVVQKVLTP